MFKMTQDRLLVNWRPDPLVLNISHVTLLVPVTLDNFGGKSQLVVSAVILPQDLLLFSVDDGGEFQVVGDSVVRVGLETDPPEVTQLTSPFTLLLRSCRPTLEHERLHCFRWNSGRWVDGDCWYLGRNDSADVCQCTSAGIYALFRKRPMDGSIQSGAFYASDVASIAVCLVALCGQVGSVLVAQSRGSEQLVADAFLLQMAVAWMAVLVSCVARHPLRAVGCLTISILFQHFLVASLLLLLALVAEEHVRIGQQGLEAKNFLLKASLSAWAVASLVFLTIPLRKWRLPDEDCWIVDGHEFWYLLASIAVLSIVTWILRVRNYQKRRELTDFEFTLKDFCWLMQTLLMPVAAVAAVLYGSGDHHSLAVRAAFCITSSLWCVSLLFNSWPTSSKPELNKSYNPNQDFRLKSISGSSILY